MRTYDLIIIGAGPAGVTAAIYAKNFGIDFLMIGEKAGGLTNKAYKVENYPGIFSVSGEELVEKFIAHQKYLKIPYRRERVKDIKKQRKIFKIYSNKNSYQTKVIVLAFGTETKKIDIKNIEKFENRKTSKNKIVAVVGGANAAVMRTVKLAKEAKKVYLIYRRDKLRADKLWVDRVKKLKNVEIIYNTNAVELKGKKELENIILDNKQEITVDNIFMETGTAPNTLLIKDLGIKTDKGGYIKTNNKQATNIYGVFAAGDITTSSNNFRQIITACAEGAIAALSAFNYLKKI